MSQQIKNSSLILVMLGSVLLQGCAKSHKSSKQISPNSDIPAQEVVKETLIVPEGSKEALEREIEELEHEIRLYNEETDDPIARIGKTVGIPFKPYVYMVYFFKKVEYIKKYGTEEEKKELEELHSGLDSFLGKKK